MFPTPMGLFLLDYGAGNVQSLANTLERLGYSFKWISSPSDFDGATVSPCDPRLLTDHMFIPGPVHVNHSLLSFPVLALSRLQSMA
jgi:imidazoleglycerol phosphate synthase glutamine amidotransferase subunit HisH